MPHTLATAAALSARRHATTDSRPSRRSISARKPSRRSASSVLPTLLVTKTSSCGRYSGSISLPVISSSMPTSSRIVVPTPVPMLKNVSVASALSERMFARATSSTWTKS